MTVRECAIHQSAVLRQAVLNTSNSIEVFREAMSNSIDADCKCIDIRLTGQGGDLWDIVITDDGHGMLEKHMNAFFDTGDSVKDTPARPRGIDLKPHLSIGEKGLGSKTTFVAASICIKSIRRNTRERLLGEMRNPMATLEAGKMPSFEIRPPAETENWTFSQPSGTSIELRGVRIPVFNGKKCDDPTEIANRLMHYLRSQCATGTVKHKFAGRQHVRDMVFNASVVPEITLEVSVPGKQIVRLGPLQGVFELPNSNIVPTGGAVHPASKIPKHSEEFCDLLEFSGSKTLNVRGQNTTVHYDGLVIIAGDAIRRKMLEHEIKQGWNQKTLMGLHLCRDFIPLKVDTSLARQYLNGEWYYEFKAFLNCQWFTLNADRNTVTNLESDEIQWVFEDFRANVFPQIEKRYDPYRQMKEREERAIDAFERSEQVRGLQGSYKKRLNLTLKKAGAALAFAKAPQLEADVSHLLAMALQSGHYSKELNPLVKFGSYIDKSTDLLCEDAKGDPLLVEVELSLPRLFAHGHPVASYDLVVVWDLGNMSDGDIKNAYWGDDSGQVAITLKPNSKGGWQLKWGTHIKQVIVLSEFL